MNEKYALQLARWHEFVAAPNAAILDELLADDVKFHSPFVWKPKHGKAMTTAILLTVTEVFCQDSKPWMVNTKARHI